MVSEAPSSTRSHSRCWTSYNESLVRRGDISILIDPELLRPDVWLAARHGRAHRPDYYSDAAIRFVLTLAAIYGQPLRQAEGLCRGVLRLLGVDLPAPDYSTLARRRRRLKLRLPRRLPAGARCIAIDSTGFATYEPSAWRRRRGEVLPKRRWRKLHLLIDTDTREILSLHVTGCEGYGSGDSMAVGPLLGQLHDPIIEARADGAYDAQAVRRALCERGARVIIPPQHNARLAKASDPKAHHPPWVSERDSDIIAIRKLGLKAWKQAAGYGQRSTIESVIASVKTTLGERLRARTEAGADAELLIRASAYNQLALMSASGR